MAYTRNSRAAAGASCEVRHRRWDPSGMSVACWASRSASITHAPNHKRSPPEVYRCFDLDLDSDSLTCNRSIYPLVIDRIPLRSSERSLIQSPQLTSFCSIEQTVNTTYQLHFMYCIYYIHTYFIHTHTHTHTYCIISHSSRHVRPWASPSLAIACGASTQYSCCVGSASE